MVTFILTNPSVILICLKYFNDIIYNIQKARIEKTMNIRT
jgi:hypothetical protein